MKMKPLVERLEQSYSGKVEFRRLNVGTDRDASDLANKLGARYVPTFVFVNSDGVIAKTVVGEMTEQAMTSELTALK
jgi:thiol-disulfide isomerase/thioredoxin